MNILSIGGRYKPTNGGNAKRISTMCEAFCKAGHCVTVMTCDGYDNCPKQDIIEGVRIKRYMDCNMLVMDVLSTASEFSATIILVHEETYLRKLKRLKPLQPIVYECHAIEPNPNRIKEFVLSIVRKFYFNKSFTKRVFVLSKKAGKSFSERFLYPEALTVYAPNGLDKNNYYTKNMHYGEQEHFVYGYGGTLYEFQGIFVIMKYMKDILNIAPDVRIMIVGGGPLENDVKAFVSDNHIEDRVTVTGSVSQERFDELTQTFDVMLMPRPSLSSTESAVPLKIFDAAIHKKPVVMSNVSGLTEAFSDSAALIYDTKTPDDFVECCKKIYRNTELAEKLVKGEEEALDKWPSIEDVAKIQLNAMEQVIKESMNNGN